jgi:hypothetical protein
MRKLVFTTVLILMAGMTYGQTLQKGTLIGTHVMQVTFQPGVSMEKFIEFYSKKFIPEYEKNRIGWKIYLVKSIRGEIKDSFGLIMIIKSEKDRDKYYNPDGSLSQLGITVEKNYKPVVNEMNKLGTLSTTFTDWIVQ